MWCPACSIFHEAGIARPPLDSSERHAIAEATAHLTDADIAVLSVWFGPRREAPGPRPKHWGRFTEMGSE